MWQDTASITAMLTDHSKYSRSIYDADKFYLQKFKSSKPIELSEYTTEPKWKYELTYLYQLGVGQMLNKYTRRTVLLL